jgi:O-antigen/teichoic acid export membrane protein
VIESLHVLSGFAIGLTLILSTDLRSAGPFVGLLVAAAILAIFEAPWLTRQVRGGRFSPERANTYLTYGAALSGAFALEQMLAVSDRFFIAHFLGEEALASYAAGYGLAVRGLDLLFVWASTAIAPLLVARYESEGPDAARAMAKSSVCAMLAVSVPAAVGIAVVARPLAEVLVGPALATDAARIIPFVTAAGLAAGFMTHYLAEAFLLTRRTGLRVLLLAPAVVVNIGLNATLIPHFGVNGAIAATLIAYWLAAVLLYLGARRLIGLPFPLEAAARVLAAAGVMAGFVTLLPAIGGLPELLLKSACGALVYVIAAAAINAAGVRDALLSLRLRRQAHAP